MYCSRLPLRSLRAPQSCRCNNPIRRCLSGTQANQNTEQRPAERRFLSKGSVQPRSDLLLDQRTNLTSASDLVRDPATQESLRTRAAQITFDLRCLRPPFDKHVLPQWRKEIDQSRRQWDHLLAQHVKAPQAELQALASAFDGWRRKFPLVLAGQQRMPVKEQARRLWEQKSVHQMRVTWESEAAGIRQQIWPTVMLSTMVNKPEMTQRVLEATLSQQTPGYAIDDVLLFIAGRVNPRGTSHWDSKRLLDLVIKILDDHPPERLLMSQRTILRFIRKFGTSEVAELCSSLLKRDRILRTDTLLHAVRKLSRRRRFKSQAFGMFKERILDPKLQQIRGVVNLQDAKVASVITSLISATYEESDHEDIETGAARFSPTDALEFFMDQGFQPNIITLTALLDNLGSQGEVDEAFRLAHTFTSAGIRFDERAISSLLKMAKANLRPDKVAECLELASKVGVDDLGVTRSALHSIFYFAHAKRQSSHHPPRTEQAGSMTIFLPLLRLYVQRFSLWELQRWIPETLPLLLERERAQAEQDPAAHPEWAYGDDPGRTSILSVVEEFISKKDGQTLLVPDATTLTIMLRAYIRDMTTQGEVLSFYSHFKTQVESVPDDLLSQHIRRKGDGLLYDTLLLTMTEIKGMAKVALQLFKDLSFPAVGKQNVPADRADQQPSPHPPASMYTWTIMMKGLFKQEETGLATELLSIMRKQGFPLTLPAFNAVVKGYAMSQDMEKTIETLQLLEDQGLNPNDRTMRAFGYLRSQSTAIKKMEQIIEANRKSLQEGALEYYG